MEQFQGLNVSGVVILLFTWAVFAILSHNKRPKGKIYNDTTGFDWLYTKARKRYIEHGPSLLKAACEQSPDAFYIVTSRGLEMILSHKYLHEIRNDNRFNVLQYNEKSLHGRLPGFEVFSANPVQNEVFTEVFRRKAASNLGRFLQPMSEEINDFLRTQWTDSPGWHTISLGTSVANLVAQEASRVFVGPKLCRDEAWLRLVVGYQSILPYAIKQINTWPPLLRPLAARILPTCKQLRSEITKARRIIGPVVAERRSHSPSGTGSERPDDLLQWLEDEAKGVQYDPVLLMLRAAAASVFSTAELITQTIFNLCTRAELIKDLRAEAAEVFRKHGLQKSTIYDLKLMDSVLKETQRLKPISVSACITLAPFPHRTEKIGRTDDACLLALTANFTRMTTDDVRLSDGLEIPKGTMIQVSNRHMFDPKFSEYPNADQFDGYRFYKLRQVPGRENSSQLVSTNAENPGFGHGKTACPGRFFAANAAKLILSHIILEYDIKLLDGQNPVPGCHAEMQIADLSCGIAVRRRQGVNGLSNLIQSAKYLSG